MREHNPNAFPNSREACQYGMSLEDYYAGQALAGITANANLLAGLDPEFIRAIARDARSIAKAMLEVRSNG
ncbi:hypothetical protein [Lentibacter algarum]|mgnify:CR=1 FL=1|uniref:hypothetical protein n=1 Tax=Lentibacter algarum TaxID=576131 RepID=UPI0026E96A63|nr:hypothetical protein [Lentibacter algarum]